MGNDKEKAVPEVVSKDDGSTSASDKAENGGFAPAERAFSEAVASRAVSIWRTNETLLQSYRGMFLTLHSVLLSAASLVLAVSGGGGWYSGIPLAIAVLGLVLVFAWIRVTSDREDIIGYWVVVIMRIESGEVSGRLLCDYEGLRRDKSGSALRERTDQLRKQLRLQRYVPGRTRRLFSRNLPIGAVLLWLVWH